MAPLDVLPRLRGSPQTREEKRDTVHWRCKFAVLGMGAPCQAVQLQQMLLNTLPVCRETCTLREPSEDHEETHLSCTLL